MTRSTTPAAQRAATTVPAKGKPKPAKRIVEPDGGVASVERAISILLAFRPGDKALALTDIAQRTGLYKSTILRLMKSLERNNCAVRLSDGRYQLGATLLHLGGLYQRSLKLEDHIIPELQQLVRQTGESASFHIRQGNSRLC